MGFRPLDLSSEVSARVLRSLGVADVSRRLVLRTVSCLRCRFCSNSCRDSGLRAQGVEMRWASGLVSTLS